MPKKKKICIIIDVDGTIVSEKDNSQIILPTENNRKVWDLFHKNKKYYRVSQFKPNKNIVDIIKSIISNMPEVYLVFLTARENIENKPIFINTYRLIRKIFGFQPTDFGRRFTILMRKENDFRSSDIVKEDILNDEILHDYLPILAIDDEEPNIKMFERNNINCIRAVRKGDLLNG